MSFKFTFAFVYLLLAFILYDLFKLSRYIQSARSTGLRYVVVPCLETEIIAQLSTPLIRKLCAKRLDQGKGWPRWCRFSVKDWSWEDKRHAHKEYGDVFLVVSPQGIICYCADAAMAWDVMNRRYDFIKPRDKYKILEPYGPNVATAEGSTYRFHVRMTAPSFADGTGVNDLVWQETSRQTKLLMDLWTKAAPENLNEDINALTLGVISLAGFGKKIESVQEQSQTIPVGYKVSFLRALRQTTHNMLAILVFPTWVLDWTPYAAASLAKKQLDKYLREMIHRERISRGAGVLLGPRGNLLETVVHATQGEGEPQTKKSPKDRQLGFSENEVMGNLFIYLLGGYETTANSIQYGLLVLASVPDLQSRVIEEIDSIYEKAATEGRQELTYKDDFPRLEYTYGFMYETFRLYPGVTLITKMCKEAQTVRIQKQENEVQTITLPPECRVYLSAPGVHYHPLYWKDPEDVRPERWLGSIIPHDRGDGPIASGKNVVAADKTRQMRGTLLTFSDGARACLGRKFAQAEYVAFFTTLLRRFRVAFAPGVDIEQAKFHLRNRSSGKITLAPIDGFHLVLQERMTV